jgi:hypothetical protein
MSAMVIEWAMVNRGCDGVVVAGMVRENRLAGVRELGGWWAVGLNRRGIGCF